MTDSAKSMTSCAAITLPARRSSLDRSNTLPSHPNKRKTYRQPIRAISRPPNNVPSADPVPCQLRSNRLRCPAYVPAGAAQTPVRCTERRHFRRAPMARAEQPESQTPKSLKVLSLTCRILRRRAAGGLLLRRQCLEVASIDVHSISGASGGLVDDPARLQLSKQ